MATRSHLHRTLAICVALAALLVGASACKVSDSPTPGPSGTGAEGLGSAATASAKPTTKPPVIAVPAYPSTAKAYAEAILAAWKAHNLSRLGDLTTPEVQEQIIEIPGPPNLNWTYMRCDGTAGSSYCSFYNADGDEITLRISHQLLGKAHAGIQVIFDYISFPNDGVLYVKEFVGAWQKGNKARMNALAVASVVTYANATSPPTSPSYPAPTCCGGGLLQVVVQWGPNEVTFDVGTTKLGGKDAIVGHTVS